MMKILALGFILSGVLTLQIAAQRFLRMTKFSTIGSLLSKNKKPWAEDIPK